MATKKTTKKEAAPAVEVLTLPEQALVAKESLGLIEWLKSLVPFFTEAAQIEKAAVARLARIRALSVPETKEQDEAIRQEVIGCRDAKKGALAHWDAVTGLLSRVHKMTTTARARATGPLEEGERLATGLHERYVANEKRRADLAAAEARRIEEAKAEQDRQRRLAEFEAAALKAEEDSPLLSAREGLFVESYMRHGDGQRAARDAGYQDPVGQAARLIASDKVRKAIEAKRTAHTMRTQIEVMKEMPAFVDHDAIEEANKPQLNTGDRYTWSAEVVDLEAFRNAAFEGGYSIPREVFVVDGPALNRLAKTLEQNIERWPGIKAKKTTTVLR